MTRPSLVCLAAAAGVWLGLAVLAAGQTTRPVTGGCVRANVWARIPVPGKPAADAVEARILDPWERVLWSGRARDGAVECYTRDWTDGTYTLELQSGAARAFRVDTEYLESVRARAGLMLRTIEKQRDADGMAPPKLARASDLLQRIVTEYVGRKGRQDVDGNLFGCEQQLGFRTATATVRILGSGAAQFSGYDEPYKPGLRERSTMFMPPHAIVDCDVNTPRKLKRWGYLVKEVEHVFISHSHADHFATGAIVLLANERGRAGLGPLHVHAGKAACDELGAVLAIKDMIGRVTIDRLEPGGTAQAGELQAKAVRATHQEDSSPLCYIFHWRGTTVYYGTDTGYPKAETYAALAAEKFDVFAHDLTAASAEDGIAHTDIGDLQRLVGKLRAAGAIGPWTRVIGLHLPPEGSTSWPDNEYWERMIGFEGSYDGMPVPIAFRADGPAKTGGKQ